MKRYSDEELVELIEKLGGDPWLAWDWVGRIQGHPGGVRAWLASPSREQAHVEIAQLSRLIFIDTGVTDSYTEAIRLFAEYFATVPFPRKISTKRGRERTSWADLFKTPRCPDCGRRTNLVRVNHHPGMMISDEGPGTAWSCGCGWLSERSELSAQSWLRKLKRRED